jgi:anti-sigma regulatory factor (Ser/Thr protein kinase)
MRGELRAFLAAAGVADGAAAQIVLATHELLANAVLHARTGRILVTGRADQEAVEVTVRDFGTWRERSNARADGGRGLVLVERLVDELRVVHGDDGTCAVLLARL